MNLELQVVQLKEFMKTYQKVTQVCFMDCVKDFNTRELSKEENNCQANCLKKYMAITTRIAQRFTEYHMQSQEGQMPLGADHGASKF